MQDTAFQRIQRSLDHIHNHLDETLTVESLAEKSCWSRWQFQRVFNHFTGLTVAQYIRELRLSKAAEFLLTSKQKQLDIALICGFDSEVSFSRSFRQMFGCTPGHYRRRGKRIGLKTPMVPLQWGVSLHGSLALAQEALTPTGLAYSPDQVQRQSSTFVQDPILPKELEHKLLQIRVESQPEMQVLGVTDQIQGIFADKPDFSSKVPEIWRHLQEQLSYRETDLKSYKHQGIGVLDTRALDDGDTFINYWACIDSTGFDHSPLDKTHGQQQPLLQQLTIPAQEYAVIPFSGPAHLMDDTLAWFIYHWLPGSGYSGINQFDLEIYPRGFVSDGQHLELEYWVPVTAQ